MPDDKWDTPNIPKAEKLHKGGFSLQPREKPPEKLEIGSNGMFDENGMYVPRKERNKR